MNHLPLLKCKYVSYFYIDVGLWIEWNCNTHSSCKSGWFMAYLMGDWRWFFPPDIGEKSATSLPSNRPYITRFTLAIRAKILQLLFCTYDACHCKFAMLKDRDTTFCLLNVCQSVITESMKIRFPNQSNHTRYWCIIFFSHACSSPWDNIMTF